LNSFYLFIYYNYYNRFFQQHFLLLQRKINHALLKYDKLAF